MISRSIPCDWWNNEPPRPTPIENPSVKFHNFYRLGQLRRSSPPLSSTPVYQYGRNEDKVLKCTNIPSDIDSIHNKRPKPIFGDIWSTARGPRHPPSPKRGKKRIKINSYQSLLGRGGVAGTSSCAPNVTKTWLWSPVMYWIYIGWDICAL